MLLNGKLKMTNELYPQAQQNKFAHPDTEITVLSEASLTEFCETPRTATEITTHFKISSNEATSYYLQPLICAGKLFHARPLGSKRQRFASKKIASVAEQDVVEFCKTARTRKEIAEKFQMSQRTARSRIRELIKADRLNYTVPEYPKSPDQQYIASME
jgi:predicted HTH transcriptional regulator